MEFLWVLTGLGPFLAEAFAQLAENGLLYSTNRLLDRAPEALAKKTLVSEVKPLLFACLLDKETPLRWAS